ncbi:nucleotide-diphospho-sugar transferase [Aspergillus uvarum CBS 121591]|uniref:Nucleotide-diphospho-sugar transferase n=1 Tax=Aspergillus uvarum CBS 121591 TaxID=1448315 RepID=A0A319D9A7_9EURO|nr:nucleotide-diphospho-sugar transferase [Aspergillus uvarum CBS 121591]PYH84568.1 nucleotide-diphospho-sugar transferase [Aspergillus uvarum CBS 121591]
MTAPRRTILASLLFILNICYIWHKLPTKPNHTLEHRQSQLWHQLFPLLTQHAPNCPPPILHGTAGTHRFDSANPIPRENYIINSEAILRPMQTAHGSFVHAIQHTKFGIAYNPDTRGIVTAAGGTYLPTFMVTLKLLRRTGSTLPVEVFMKDSAEYEATVCETILPPLGAKCILLSDLTPGLDFERITGFQLKALAILFSSFEDVLWLDADCIPLYDPIPLLTSEPFTTKGLVSWPDFWADTASPLYFEVSQQKEPDVTARAASEAGMLLLSKRSHFGILLLAVYYNVYGPEFYYPLLSQGAPGAGDKDTFLHAAAAMETDFYAVGVPPVDLGRMNTGGKSTVALNSGFIQADPIQDYARVHSGAENGSAPRAFFIHAGNPEFNPGKELLGRKLKGLDRRPARLWTYPPEALARVGFDAERVFWEGTVAVACEMGEFFESWEGKRGLCEKVRAHFTEVFADKVGD